MKKICLTVFVFVLSITISNISINADVSNSMSSAQPITSTYNETLSMFGDVDWYKYTRNYYSPWQNIDYNFYTTGSTNTSGKEEHYLYTRGGEPLDPQLFSTSNRDSGSGTNFKLTAFGVSKMYSSKVRVMGNSYYTSGSYQINVSQNYDAKVSPYSYTWVPNLESYDKADQMDVLSITYLNADDAAQFTYNCQSYQYEAAGFADEGTLIVAFIPVISNIESVLIYFNDNFASLEESTIEFGDHLQVNYVGGYNLYLGTATSTSGVGLKITQYRNSECTISSYNPANTKYGVSGVKGSWKQVDDLSAGVVYT